MTAISYLQEYSSEQRDVEGTREVRLTSCSGEKGSSIVDVEYSIMERGTKLPL